MCLKVWLNALCNIWSSSAFINRTTEDSSVTESTWQLQREEDSEPQWRVRSGANLLGKTGVALIIARAGGRRQTADPPAFAAPRAQSPRIRLIVSRPRAPTGSPSLSDSCFRFIGQTTANPASPCATWLIFPRCGGGWGSTRQGQAQVWVSSQQPLDQFTHAINYKY